MVLDISYSDWNFMEQKDPFKTAKEPMQNKWQNLSKTEQSVKTNFFEALNLLRSEKLKNNESCIYILGLRTKNPRSFSFFCEFLRI